MHQEPQHGCNAPPTGEETSRGNDDSNSIHVDIDNEIHVQNLKKNLMLLYFSDPHIEGGYQKFMERRTERNNYYVSSIMLRALLLLAVLKYPLYSAGTSHGLKASENVMFRLAYIMFALGTLIFVLFSVLQQWPSLLPHMRPQSLTIHQMKSYIIFATALCFLLEGGFHYFGRLLNGACESGVPEIRCNQYPETTPTIDLLFFIINVICSFMACKSMFEFQALLIFWAVEMTVIMTSFILVGSTEPLVATAFLCCVCLLVVPYVLSYQQMTTFEYHMALSASVQRQIDLTRTEAERETTQLKMVLANVAHDLKTPLQAFSAGLHSMENMVAEISSNTIDADFKSNFLLTIKDMKAGYAFMMMQINRALDVSKSDSGVALLPKPESFLLGDTVEWAVGIMSAIQASVKIRLISEPGTLVTKAIISDKGWMQEDLLCMLSNAVKYSPKDSTVTVRLSLSQPDPEDPGRTKSLIVEVEDEGVGVSAEMQRMLFKPFVQAQRRAGGTGLGLYSMALRIKASRGSYGIRPTNGRTCGSVFFFSVPYVEDTSVEYSNTNVDLYEDLPMTLDNNTENSFGTTSTSMCTPSPGELCRILSFGSNPTVLLVDDSPAILKIMSRVLARASICVETAVDGLSAYKMMKEKLYTAVIMDIQMPIMDGLESVIKLRAFEKNELENGDLENNSTRVKQYVIGASACGRDETKHDAFAAGMDEFMVKPVDIPLLLSKINSMHKASGMGGALDAM